MMEREKKYIVRERAAFLLLTFLVIFCSLGIGDSVYGAESAKGQTRPASETVLEKPVRPANTAKSGVVIDGDTGKIIYSKYPHKQRDPLSTTKLLTALVALEHLDIDDTVTVTRTAADTPGSTAGLITGEKIKVRDLIYGAMLPSGNDAAVALAVSVSGTKAKFAKLMNEKAEELGCEDSHFSNPHGWKAGNHYSSAYDMAVIAKEAMEIPIIKRACSTEIYRMAKTNKHKSRLIATTNYFVAKKKYPECGVFAGKTGTWESYNASLISACRRNGKVVYASVLQDTTMGRYTTTNKILNYSYKKLAWMAESESI